MAETRLQKAPIIADVTDTTPAEAEVLGDASATPPIQASGPSATERLEELLQTDTTGRVKELSDSDGYTDDDASEGEQEDMADPSTTTTIPTRQRERVTPSLFTTLPLIKDNLETQTSHKQEETVEQVLPWHVERHPELELNRYDVPKLQKDRHIKFLRQWLRKFPAHFVAVDASRPWMMYWSLAGIGALGHDIESDHEAYVERYVLLSIPLCIILCNKSIAKSTKTRQQRCSMLLWTASSKICVCPYTLTFSPGMLFKTTQSTSLMPTQAYQHRISPSRPYGRYWWWKRALLPPGSNVRRTPCPDDVYTNLYFHYSSATSAVLYRPYGDAPFPLRHETAQRRI